MSTVIIVDSACDLPKKITDSAAVAVLPLNVILGETEYRDRYSPQERLQLIEGGSLDIKHQAETAPATRDQIVEFLTQQILPHYDFAIVQTVARFRSPQYEMWQEVNLSFAAHYREYRQSDNNFTLRIMDSGTMFTGQGLMALNTIHLAKQKVSRRDLLEKSKAFADHIQSYSAPADLQYLRERARKRGDRTTGFFSALLGKALDISPIVFGGQNETATVGKLKGHKNAVNTMVNHAMQAMDKGLASPVINVSYGGELKELKRYPILDELKAKAKDKGVTLCFSVATPANIINMGPGTFSLAVAPADPQFRIGNNGD